MGVQGLTPFLQKTCPGVIKQFPERLQALSGKRIVIDGTLITQRFHFAPMPQQYRHVLSWYRLARHLKHHNIQAICVFDGKQRSVAKAREIERRRQDRMLTAARGIFENDRLDRLRRLSGSLRSISVHEPDEQLASLRPQDEQLASLKPRAEQHTLPRSSNTANAESSGGDDSSKGLPSLERQVEQPTVPANADAASTPAEVPVTIANFANVASPAVGDTLDLPEGLPEDLVREGSHRSIGDSLDHVITRSPKATNPPIISYDSDGELDSTPSSEDMPITPEDGEGIAENISQLYAEYCKSVPRLVSLSQASPDDVEPLDAPANLVPEEDIEAAKAEYALSKTQHGLMIEEGRFWEQLVEAVEKGDINVLEAAQLAESLESKSSMLSESYMRRTHPPTSQTYDESKEILHAMGIPCIEPSGPYEAEALAASVVLHGHADYVASEDTDVLIYDAPLIRNLGSINGPIVVISGAEVRTVLQLDRAQFIDFALLLGTDFSQRIKNVGPTRALKFIREHGKIEQVLQHETKYPPRISLNAYLEQVQLAREVFQTLPPMPDVTSFNPGNSDEKEVWMILEKYGLRRYVIDQFEADCSQALSGNYFEDNPSAL
ncbi:PIN domain-like protein [Daedaleopsis nitida]|nr:PIN domain-like protein [Daedaleopsis nitida]